MLTLLALTLLSQTTPAIRRSTPQSGDPGMVVRQAGTVTVTGTITPTAPDGGIIGYLQLPDGGGQPVSGTVTVNQGLSLDGGYSGWHTESPAHISFANSNDGGTGTLLAGGGVFTGTAVDVLEASQVMVSSFSNVASAALGLSLQFSPDGTNWDHVQAITAAAGVSRVLSVNVIARYFRVVYTNGAVAQTTWRLQTLLKPVPSNGSVQDLDIVPKTGDEALLTQSVIVGVTTAGGGAYVPVKVNPSGALTADVTQGTSPWLVAGRDGGTLEVTTSLSGVGTVDTFGALRVGTQQNQIDVPFYRDTPANLMTVTLTGSGTAAAVSGGAQFSSGAGAAGTSKGVSKTTTIYRGGSEVYAYFTAAFGVPSTASAFDRIGLFDTNNGFFIGYDGTTFKSTIRIAGVDTSTAKTSWNQDTLVGGASSKFTRLGVPEAINLTLLNVYRIRFGWLGAAPIEYEVLAPDGHWVLFHRVLYPNTLSIPSVDTADLPITIEVSKTAAGAALTITTGCVAAGTTANLAKPTATLSNESLMETNRSVLTATSTADAGFVNVQATVTGDLFSSSYPRACSQTVQNTYLMDAGSITLGGTTSRLYSVVCNSRDNTSGTLRCRADADGGTVAITAGTTGATLSPGDCVSYSNPSTTAIRCAGTSIYATIDECIQ